MEFEKSYLTINYMGGKIKHISKSEADLIYNYIMMASSVERYCNDTGLSYYSAKAIINKIEKGV
jgi:hypothetical protein